MSEAEQPKEPENPVFERDKTAKDPVPETPQPPQAVPPTLKPRKVFVPRKVVAKTDKPQEYRTRHIRVTSLESANLLRQTLLDFQKELAGQPSDDPDKDFEDRKKVEAFFGRIAKKYSLCPTRAIGGDLDWVYKDMKFNDEVMTGDLIDAIVKAEKFVIPEPVKTRLGYHIVLVCENQALRKKEETPSELDPRYEALQARPEAKPPTRTDIPT
ncbi:MAG: peptidylprolyl isomerase [Nitrospinae bacterium]|nr:peptidylprolyl isomerase [Nitrospinota bacterium]